MLYRILLAYALGKGFTLGLWRQPPPMVPTGPRVVRVKADYRVILPKQLTGGEMAYRAWFGDATP